MLNMPIPSNLKFRIGKAQSKDGKAGAANGPSTTKKPCHQSGSNNSIKSCASVNSLENRIENETLEFMRHFVNILFNDSSSLTLELKSKFGIKTRVNFFNWICFILQSIKLFLFLPQKTDWAWPYMLCSIDQCSTFTNTKSQWKYILFISTTFCNCIVWMWR